MSNTHNPTSNLLLTRKQLDELDVLVQKMLNLPEANIPAEAPQKAEPDFSSMGIFSPGEAPWAPKIIEPSTIPPATAPAIAQIPKEEYKPVVLQSILNRQPQIPETSPPKIEKVQVESTQPSEPLSGWKPSPLTWAPLAQSWEKLRQEELQKQQKGKRSKGVAAGGCLIYLVGQIGNPTKLSGLPLPYFAFLDSLICKETLLVVSCF